MRNIAVGRLVFLGLALLIAVVAGCYLGEPLKTSHRPSEFIGLTFSILAASLFAVVSIIGDPSMLLPGSWRLAWEGAKTIQTELQRLNLLFVWYLLTLGLLVASEIVKHESWHSLDIIHNVLGFFAAFGFIVSLALPFKLQSIQRERLLQEINHRKEVRAKATAVHPKAK